MAVVVDTHTLTQVSQDVANNTSVVRYLVKLKTTEGSYNVNNITTTYKIDGTTYTSVHKLPLKTTTTIVDKTVTVNHNADGTKTVNAEFSCPTNISAGTIVRSISTTLSTIPRASSITCNDANIGSSTTININKASSSFTTTLSYKASGQSSWTTIVTKTSQASYGWTVPTSFYSLIPSNPTITCEIKGDTYSGNTLVGSKTTTATFTATGNPTLSNRLATDVNSTTANLTTGSSTSTTKMVKYASNIKVQITAVAQNSAYISSVKVNGSNVSLDGSSSSSTRSGNITFNGATTNTFSIVVTDSRGNSTTQNTSNTLTMIDYVPLTINQNIKRNTSTDGKINVSLSGNCWNGNFRSGVSNTLTVQYRFKEYGASSWQQSWTNGNTTPSRSGNTYTYSKTLTDMDYTKSYSFEVRATDKIGTQTITGITVTKGQPTFWWNSNKLEVTGDMVVNDILRVKNDIQVDDQFMMWSNTYSQWIKLSADDIADHILRRTFSISNNASKTIKFQDARFNVLFASKGGYGGSEELWCIATYGAGESTRMHITKLVQGASSARQLTYTIDGRDLIISNATGGDVSCALIFLIRTGGYTIE